MKTSSLKVLDNNKGEYIHNLRIKKDFLNKAEVQRIKENNDRFGYIKINNFSSSKNIIKIVKTQTEKKYIYSVWS